MTTTKDVLECESLEQLSGAQGRVKFIPHGPMGQWPLFVQGCGDTSGWTETAVLRELVAFGLGRPGTPFVVSLLHTSTEDESPSARVICYDVTYDQLIQLDQRFQPSWFTVYAERDGDLFTLTLIPTRSLQKLIYKMVI